LPGENLVAAPQPEDGVTYAAKLSRKEGRLDWTLTAEELERSVRALNPWPGVWFEHQGERIKVLVATVAAGDSAPGTVLDGFNVACGKDALNITKSQRPGKRPLDAEAFLRGYNLNPGTVLA
jgi:methionyl-tRNA formyltransferase